jgi:ligand-binding sensor domain-containing protein
MLTDEDGLPSMTVYNLIEAKDQSIWLATANGLSHFDGSRIRTFRHPDQTDHEIMGLQEDAHSRIWFYNLSGQLYYHHQGQVHPFLNDPAYPVRFLLVTQHHIWVTGKYQGQWELRVYPIDASKMSSSVTPVFTQRVAAYSCHGIFNISDQVVLVRFTTTSRYLYINLSDPTHPLDPASVQSLHKRLSGNTANRMASWKKYSVSSFESNIFLEKSDSVKLKHTNITSLLEANEQLLVGSKNGVYLFPHPLQLQQYKHYFPQWQVNCLLQDRQGNTWITTTGNGVAIVPSFNIFHYHLQNAPIPNHNIQKIINLNQEGVLVGHRNNGVTFIDLVNNKFNNQGKSFAPVRDLVKDDKGGIWCATESGLYYTENTKKEFRPILNLLSIKSLTYKNGLLYVGSNRGYYPLNTKHLPTLKESDSLLVLLNNRVFSVLAIGGQVLLGTEKGVFLHEPTLKKPPQPIPQLSRYQISDMVRAANGIIWVGTKAHGLFQLHGIGGSVIQFDSKRLPGKIISDLELTPDQKLWVATDQGLVCLDANTGKSLHFINSSFLPSHEISSICSRGEELYVGTHKGLLRFINPYQVRNNLPQEVTLAEIQVNDEVVPISNHLQLKHDQNNIQVFFQIPGYQPNMQTTYQYKVEGLDNEWHQTTSEKLQWFLVRPGNYRLHLRANPVLGQQTQPSTILEFNIASPFWETWWFLGLVGVAVFGTGYYVMYFRHWYKVQQKEAEQSFQEKVNALKQQALQAQLNPHFIFNALNAIMQYVATNDKDKALYYLSRFSKLIRTILEASRKRSILLEDEIELLKNYLEMEQLRYQQSFQISWFISKEIQEQESSILIPPLLIQPILENSLKHGLKNKSDDNKILKISFEKQGEFLCCTVEDNGIGRAAARSLNEWRNTKHHSSGLAITQDRIKSLNTTSEIQSYEAVLTEDLYDANGQPSGTKTTILLPI